MSAEISRRASLVLAVGAGLALTRPTHARARQPLGGRIELRVPWPTASLDPHRIDDVACAIFGGAVFDSLFDGTRPMLAESAPEIADGGARIKLRAGVTTAAGRPLLARDVAASLARARSGDARAWLADVPAPRRVDDTTLVFPNVTDLTKLTAALSSPLCAIVPATFATTSRFDGTGAFSATRDGDALSLARNVRAAQGAAFLDGIIVRSATDLADSLRSFEAARDHVGWLGLGLHEPRAGAKSFDGGSVGFSLLRTGRDAGSWDAPGTAQRLANGIAPSQLASLAPGAPWTVEPDQGWGAAPCELLVREDAPYLIEMARVVAAALTRPSHEVTAKLLPVAQFRERRASRSYALAIDAVRPFAPGLAGVLAGLATSDNPELATDVVRHLPRVADIPPRVLARTMRIGVLGEIRVQGGRVPELTLPQATMGIDWANATWTRR